MEQKVIASNWRTGGDGVLRIECTLNDFSTWSCLPDGSDWKKEKLSDDELTTAFNNK